MRAGAQPNVVSGDDPASILIVISLPSAKGRGCGCDERSDQQRERTEESGRGGHFARFVSGFLGGEFGLAYLLENRIDPAFRLVGSKPRPGSDDRGNIGPILIREFADDCTIHQDARYLGSGGSVVFFRIGTDDLWPKQEIGVVPGAQVGLDIATGRSRGSSHSRPRSLHTRTDKRCESRPGEAGYDDRCKCPAEKAVRRVPEKDLVSVDTSPFRPQAPGEVTSKSRCKPLDDNEPNGCRDTYCGE